jgi:hypothetical protein
MKDVPCCCRMTKCWLSSPYWCIFHFIFLFSFAQIWYRITSEVDAQSLNKQIAILDSCFLILVCELITFAGIGGTRFISFEDRHWHNDCFICATCKTSLVGRGFITDADDIICPECAKQKLMWTAGLLWSSYIWLTWRNKIAEHL